MTKKVADYQTMTLQDIDGGGSGDMTKAVYDPAGKNTQLAATSDIPSMASILDAVFSAFHPVGSVYIENTGVNPGITFGRGTWVLVSQGQMIVGYKAGDPDFGTVEATGGAKIHTHADHPALTHSGGAVDAHSGAGVDAHSAHSGAGVNAHSGAGVDAHSAHSGGAVANSVTGISIGVSGAGSSHSHGAGTFASPTSGTGSSHTHTLTQSSFATTKFTTSGSGSAAYVSGGVVTTPSGAEAAHTHTGGTVTGTSATEATHTHASGSITEPNGGTGHTHGFTQPSGHSNHVFTQAVNHIFTQAAAHANHIFTQAVNHVFTQPNQHAAQSHDSPSHLNPFCVYYIWKRTA